MKFLSLALLCTLFGCAAATGFSGEKEAYYDEVKLWSGGVKIYEEYISTLHLSATFKGERFRRQFVDEYARRYRVEDDLKETLLTKELGEAELYNDFFVSAFTPAGEWNDFAESDSIWRLFLLDDEGRRLLPISITLVDEDVTFYREFFPHFDPWSKGYHVRFPRYAPDGFGPIPMEGSKTLTIEVSGLKGQADIVIDLP